MAIRTSDGVWSGTGASKKRSSSSSPALLPSSRWYSKDGVDYGYDGKPMGGGEDISGWLNTAKQYENDPAPVPTFNTPAWMQGQKSSNNSAMSPSPSLLPTSALKTSGAPKPVTAPRTQTWNPTPFVGSGWNQASSSVTASSDSVGEQMYQKRKKEEEEERARVAAEAAKPKALLPMPNIERESQAAKVQNPFDETMRGALLARMNSETQRNYTNNLENIRRNLAERGLSQAGISGIEQQAIIENEMGRGATLAGNFNTSLTDMAAQGAEFGLRQGQSADSYALGLGNLDLGFGNYGLNAQRQNVLLPLEAQAASLANKSAELANLWAMETDPIRKEQLKVALDQTKESLSVYRQMAPLNVQQAQTNLEQSNVSLEQAKQEVELMKKTAPYLVDAKIAEYKQAVATNKLREWEASNDWWLGPLGGLANFLAAVGVAAAGSAAKGALLGGG